MNRLILALALCGLSLTGICGGAAGVKASEPSYEASLDGIRLTAGFAYRNFRQAEFSHATVSGLNGLLSADGDRIMSLEEFKTVYPHFTEPGGTGPVRQVDYAGKSVSTHDGYSASESSGITLGASFALYEDERLSVDAVGNLSYFHLDSADRAGLAGSYSSSLHQMADGELSGPLPTDEPFEIPGSLLTGGSITKFDMRLWTIDLGLSVSYALENSVSLYLSFGPTFSIADMESSSYARAYSGSYGKSLGGHDNEIEFEWGLYVSAGASYMFTESLGMALEMRYDEAFGTVGTKYVKQDLDSWGSVVKLIYQF